MSIRKNTVRYGAATLAALVIAGSAIAGTPADPEFAGLATRMTHWLSGNLAISITLAFALIGAVMGMARITALPMLTSVVIAIVFSLIVGVTTGIIGAVI
jgi:hypothetical protein